ncbi:hypothetical protein Unana1_00702 [Umbelopsis nana]
MASLIAELTSLRSTVFNLEKRITQLENPAAVPVSNEPKGTPSDTTPSSNPQPPNLPPAKANLWSTVVKKHRPPTKARLATSATITFQAPPNNNKDYEIIYIPARHRITKVMARQKLRALGIHTHRVVDMHFPATATVAMLVHEDYGVEVKRILGERKIPILPFDPLDPSHLKDPKYQHLPLEQKRQKAQDLQEARLLRTLRFVKQHVAGPTSGPVTRLPRQDLATVTGLFSFLQRNQTQCC